MRQLISYTLALLVLGACTPTRAQTPRPPPRPAVVVDESQLCVPYGDGVFLRANAKHPLISQALAKLRGSRPDNTLHFYSEMKAIYPKTKEPSQLFLDVICTEYKDNEPLREAKIKLLAGIVIVSERSEQFFDFKKPIWDQITGEGYRRLVLLMESLAEHRQRALKIPPMGRPAMAPFTVCETKYIFSEYLAMYRSINTAADFTAYEKGLQRFLRDAPAAGRCSTSDLETLYVFRGDGVMKPRSPEAVIMESAGRAYQSYCRKAVSGVKPGGSQADQTCRDYFLKPYQLRFAETQAAMRAMLFYPESYTKVMGMVGSSIVLVGGGAPVMDIIVPAHSNNNESRELRDLTRTHYTQTTSKDWYNVRGTSDRLIEALDVALKPGRGKVNILKETLWAPAPDRPDEGFAKLFPLDDSAARSKVYDRLAAVFDRHTYFYRTSVYFPQLKYYSFAATAWMSSSYYIHQSHKFTFPGFASVAMDRPEMRWMYIFKVPARNNYTLEKFASGQKFSFKDDWFNERNFTKHPYGMEELAWNRLATVKPEEFEALLYLGEVEAPSELLNLARASGNEAVHQDADVESKWGLE